MTNYRTMQNAIKVYDAGWRAYWLNIANDETMPGPWQSGWVDARSADATGKRTREQAMQEIEQFEMLDMNIAERMLYALSTEKAVDTFEQQVLKFLREGDVLGRDEGAFVEYDCLEHGIVHVHGEKTGWVELDPKTCAVTVLHDEPVDPASEPTEVNEPDPTYEEILAEISATIDSGTSLTMVDLTEQAQRVLVNAVARGDLAELPLPHQPEYRPPAKRIAQCEAVSGDTGEVAKYILEEYESDSGTIYSVHVADGALSDGVDRFETIGLYDALGRFADEIEAFVAGK